MDRDFPEMLSPEDLAGLKRLAELLPPRDPLADIHNIRRNLERALSCAEEGRVMLFEAEIKHWIAGIDSFLLSKIEDGK